MSFMGIGGLELMMIIAIALVVLGPAKAINMARGAGKALGEVRRAMGDLSKAVEAEERDLRREMENIEPPDGDGRRPPGGHS